MSTIAEIYNRLALSKASMQELHDYVTSSSVPGSVQDTAENLVIDVKSKSKVALWRLWMWIMAVESWIVEQKFFAHKAEITSIVETKRPHNLRWYASECKKYQHGHALIWTGEKYSYERDDPDARIIKYASANERLGNIVLKVAKEVNGVKQPLTGAEKINFTAFWEQWKDAGCTLEIISKGPDLLKIDCTIIRDRMVLNADNSLIADSSVFPVSAAIERFGTALEFDGILRLSKLTDALQQAAGVVDVKINNAWIKEEGGAYSAIDLYATAKSGYFIIDNLNSTFNYIDDVQPV